MTTGTYTKTGACNAFYDETNNMLFRIVDNKLFLPAGGNPVYTLYDPTSSDYAKMTGEIVMIPRTRTNCCEYYIFYTVFRKNYSGGTTTGWWEIRYAIFNIHTQNIVESDFVDTIFQGGTWSTLGPGGIVASDFIGTSDNFRFYAAFTAINGTTQNSEIVVNYYEISQRNMSLVQTRVVPTDDVSLISEVELSPNLDMLCVANANPNNNYTIANAFLWKINPTTGILGTTNNDWYKLCISAQTHQVVGCEFSHDGSKLLLASAGKGFYRYNTSSFNNINFDVSITHQNALKYTHSHIERTTYDTYYVASNDGKIGKLLFGSNYVNEECTIGTVELINNSIISDYSASAPDCFVLPEQIDGSTYLYTVGNEMDCCYAYNESAVKTSMTGVSHNSTTGDITINPVTTSPYYVSWTQTSNPFTSGGVAITDVYLKGSLTIEPGARLNITGLTLHFKEAEIVQMSYNPNGTGSRLFLYNSKLTAFDDCEEDNMWGGVRCSGNYAVAQGSYTTSKQPYTYMSNSTIEYATTGVEANTGGILRAYNSNFKDNIRDVKFASFTTNDNISEFGTCNFYTTEALYAKGFSPIYHVEIWTAPGVSFRACNFSNDYAASVPLSQWGVGILATSSSITVDEKCTNPFQQLGTPCPDPSSVRGSFTNLYYGIKANIGDFMTVSRQDFNNCLGGAWLIACDAIKVTECNFDVSAMNPYQEQGQNFESYGLYVANSTGYKIEGNDFYDGILGLVVYASGEDENLVYRNDFENLTGNGQASGFVGIGISYDYDYKYGLQLQCNNFTDVDYAMTVLGGYVYGASGQIISVTQSDIRNTQGMEAYGYGHFSTHNHFDGIPLNEDRFFVVDPNVSAMPDYAYNQENATGYMLGTYSSNIRVFNQTVIPTCAQTIYTGGIVIEPLMQSIGGLNDEQSELENQLNSLTSYNDLSLSISAQSANDNNTAEVYSQLSSASPYLTSDILLAYLENPNVPELSKVSLMLENSPLPTDVVEAIENSDLSVEYVYYILKQQDGVNEIEQLQNRISGLQSARQVNYDHLMRATFNADTTEVFAETYNYVMEFMQTQNDYHAKNRLVDMYIHSQMWDEALNLLSAMESSLSVDDIAKANDIHLTEIKIDILQNLNTEPIADIVKRHNEFLTEMAADYNTKEGGVARAILESAGLMENFPIVFLPNPEADSEVSTKSARVSEPSQEPAKSGKELAAMFKLYPNPANDYLSLEFINPAGNCSFNIYTLKGDLVKSISSDQSLGFISINISDLQPGNYIVNCPELNSNQNFMIVR